MYNDLTFFLGSILNIGLLINLDLGVSFFFRINPELFFKRYSNEDLFSDLRLDFEKKSFAISPLIEYLYLNPLYSIRGGSTLLAEPFIKKPIFVLFLWNPLYKWKVLSQLIFVLSEAKTQVSFCTIVLLVAGVEPT